MAGGEGIEPPTHEFTIRRSSTELSPCKNFYKIYNDNYEQWARQSRMILITYNKGCVRFPTEGNNSSHELTTTMHHLSKSPCGGPMFLKAYTWVSNPGEVFRLPSN